MITNNYNSPIKLCYNMIFTLDNPKDLDPSYKTDLDIWDYSGSKKMPSYNQRNTLPVCKSWYQPCHCTFILVLYIPAMLYSSHLLPFLNNVTLKTEIESRYVKLQHAEHKKTIFFSNSPSYPNVLKYWDT